MHCDLLERAEKNILIVEMEPLQNWKTKSIQLKVDVYTRL